MPRRGTQHQEERDCYDIGRHLVRLVSAPAGWTVSVDGLQQGRCFRTQGEAWAAGVASAELLDSRGFSWPRARRLG